MQPADIASLRNDYSEQGIDRDTLPDNPFDLFTRWFDEALQAGLPEANGMVVATVGADAAVSQRTVLMKSFNHNGFCFYTNYHSRKANDLAGHSQVSCLFPWLALHRQVIVQGVAEKVDRETAGAYFSTRPRGSQIGAWASRQSEMLESREALHERVTSAERRFTGTDVPLPDFWGGYHVSPLRVEFWQGRSSRLHDRFVYSREAPADDSWQLQQLYP